MHEDLISIIIPCYNSERFISETLDSVLSQLNVNIEVIVIDDGSNDQTQKLVINKADNRISYFFHNNRGVSYSRNKGLLKAKGDYVVFFDSDDLMTPDFLYSRLKVLKTSSNNFVCGNIIKLTNKGQDEILYHGTSDKLIHEILFYNQSIITCPSNYLFRKSFLLQNSLCFNEKLASTADKYFLLECAKYHSGFYSNEVSVLIYRVSDDSMSNSFSKKLVLDNELFYKEILKANLIPKSIYRETLSRGYYILAGANKKLGNYFKTLYYLFKSFVFQPKYFLFKIIDK